MYTEIHFDSILSITHMKEMPNMHTHLREKGRTVQEGRIKNGVNMKHMIIFE